MGFAEFKYYGDCIIGIDGATYTDVDSITVSGYGKSWTDTVSSAKGFTMIKVPNRGRYDVKAHKNNNLVYETNIAVGFGDFVSVEFPKTTYQDLKEAAKKGIETDRVKVGDIFTSGTVYGGFVVVDISSRGVTCACLEKTQVTLRSNITSQSALNALITSRTGPDLGNLPFFIPDRSQLTGGLQFYKLPFNIYRWANPSNNDTPLKPDSASGSGFVTISGSTLLVFYPDNYSPIRFYPSSYNAQGTQPIRYAIPHFTVTGG